MSDVRQEGECVRCGKLVWRERPGEQRWTDQYGRDRCRADWDDGECDVREFTEEELEPEIRCSHAGALPVDSAGERVAWLCPVCDTQLDAGWQPPEPMQFIVELTVDHEPGAEIALPAAKGITAERYPVTETQSVITVRGIIPFA